MADAKKKILVIEDDRTLAEIYAMQLEKRGYATLLAHDGETGLLLAESQRPDLIMLDLLLPQISGLEVLVQLRGKADQTLAKTPVIVVTNLNQPSFGDALWKNGISAYFLKSDVAFTQIAAKISELLGA